MSAMGIVGAFRFWFFKILIIIGICVGAFFIPNRGFAPSQSLACTQRSASLIDVYSSTDGHWNDLWIHFHPDSIDSSDRFCS